MTGGVSEEVPASSSSLAVSYGGALHRLPLQPGVTTLGCLAEQLASTFGVDPQTIKLLPPKAKAAVLPSVYTEQLADEAGLVAGMRVMMVASRQGAVEEVRAQRELPRMRGFEEEAALAASRRRSSRTSVSGPPVGEQYTFGAYEAWEYPGLHPPKQAALQLLHRLASDRGIMGIMRKHRWSVGLLKEMPPEGKVGVSPVCILGLNVNRGQEIHLRLRTDDLRGFRRYRSIRDTLCHELAHMVWGEHDNNFKMLNSQLQRECNQLSWTEGDGGSVGLMVGSGPVAAGFEDDQDNGASTAAGFKLREWMGGGGEFEHFDPKTAAAEAAMRRLAGDTGATSKKPSASAIPLHDPEKKEEVENEEEVTEGVGRGLVEGMIQGEVGYVARLGPPLPETTSVERNGKGGAEMGDVGAVTGTGRVGEQVDIEMEEAEDEGFGGAVEGVRDEVGVAVDVVRGEVMEGVVGGEVMGGVVGGEKMVARQWEASSAEGVREVPPDPAVTEPLDAVSSGVEDPTALRFKQVESVLGQLLGSIPSAEAEAVVSTLETILRNVLELPHEEKFKRLKCSSRAFQSRVARYSAAVDVLRAAGFTYVPTDQAYCLTRNDPGLVWLILSAVQQTCTQVLGALSQPHSH